MIRYVLKLVEREIQLKEVARGSILSPDFEPKATSIRTTAHRLMPKWVREVYGPGRST